MNKYGERSLSKLNSCHIDLIKIMQLTIKRSLVDISLTEGHRDLATQLRYFKVGRIFRNGEWIKIGDTITNVDGITRKGKHNLIPSEAIDFMAYHYNKDFLNKIKYNKVHLTYIIATAICCAKELYEKGEISHMIKSGANWDNDGIISLDQHFDDYPHLELYLPIN